MSWCEPRRPHYPTLTTEKARLRSRGIDVERSTDEFLLAILTKPIGQDLLAGLSALMLGEPVRLRGRERAAA